MYKFKLPNYMYKRANHMELRSYTCLSGTNIYITT